MNLRSYLKASTSMAFLVISFLGQVNLLAQIKVDPNLKPYITEGNITGNISSVGSDTLNNLMTLWAEGFNKKYPGVNIQIEGKGSATAPPALIAGTAQLGPMSRLMKSEEAQPFSDRFNYPPTPVAVAIDALAVFVNKNNPLTEITIEEVDAIFSQNRLFAFPSDIKQWGTLGLGKNYKNANISMYGRNSASGTYGYFKEFALKKGDFKNTVKEQPGSSAVVQGVGSDQFGIGYSGIGYVTSEVKPLMLGQAGRWNGQTFEPSYANALNGKYPLSRFLYIYVNRSPKGKLDPITQAFLNYVLSKDGQEIVVKDGYYPLTAPMVNRESLKIN